MNAINAFSQSQTYTQYADYIKPDWAPPSWLFGPVWTVLYILIAISFGYVLIQAWKGRTGKKLVTPLIINLAANFAFTPIQFGLMNMKLAAVDILIVLGSLIWFIAVVWKKYRWVALMNIPYLAWVSFATILQLTVLYLNR